jgi:hypothetical protein
MVTGAKVCEGMHVSERPAPPPEGRLITDALKRTGMSVRKASKAAGISEGRWRQITSGYQTMGRGVYAPVKGPAGTVAKMARVVGVTAEQLTDAGRPDAAAELSTLAGDTPPEAAGPPEESDPREARIRAMQGLNEAEKEFYIGQLRATEEAARQRAAQAEAEQAATEAERSAGA